MCGIAGQVRLHGDRPLDAALAERAAATLAHRGPDESGTYIDPHTRACALGHRRLSVIDVCAGHQPISNERRDVWAVFNGEIYNYRELRAELESQGHAFATQSDTEVLVHLWEQHGPAMVAKLRGMFAFAIWDERRQSLFLAVDRLGKKPLYWSDHAGTFRFGSELKALLADPSLQREVDPQALLLYLTFGYVPHPWAILRGTHKLAPGHWMLVERGAVRVERYWEPPVSGEKKRDSVAPAVTFDEAKRELRDLLRDAVRARLVADVPLGAFLSGGIDSTIVVALMSELADRPVQTFTIGFDEPRFDERRYARAAARRFKTDHHELVIRPDAAEVLPLLARHYDEPFADSSAIPTYYLSRFTRQHVTVALTGDGGDELFGGYRRYRASKALALMRRIPGARALLRLGRSVLPADFERTTNLGRARRVLDAIGGSPSRAYFGQMTQFAARTLDALLHPDFARQVDANQPATWFETLATDAPAADMAADIQSYLPGDILTKVDRASMAVGLECRCPLLDTAVVEFACRLPAEWRLRGLWGHKHILRAACGDLLPAAIARRCKTGFAVPLAEWFRGPLRPMLEDELLSARATQRGYFNAATVRRLVDEHVSGARNHSGPLWLLLMLEQWHRTWLP